MNTKGYLWICCLLAVCTLRNQVFAQMLTAEQLEKVRRATVFITNEEGQGTGFLMERNSEQGLITTAAHVIGSKNQKTYDKLQVTFNSGTEFELEYKAVVVGVDYTRDIAFLRVRARNLPEPVYMDCNAPVLETEDVILAGFPLGDSLAIGGRRPKVSISKGAVSSVRRGATDAPVVIQLDANVNPGNSGGPVFNRNGRVIGIIQAKVDDTQIGFALPASFVLDDLMGNVASVTLSSLEEEGQTTTLALTGMLIDPLNRISEIQVVTGSIESIPSLDLRSSKQWPVIPHRRKLEVRYFENTFFANIRMENQNSSVNERFIQFICKRNDGTEINSPPFLIQRLLEASPKAKRAWPKSEPAAPPNATTEHKKETHVVLTLEEMAEADLPKDKEVSLQRVRNGILSQELEQDGFIFRRVLIPTSTDYFSEMTWSNSGDHLLLHGKQILLVDFPLAREVRTYDTSSSEDWRALSGDKLFLKTRRDQITSINLEKNQVESQWRVNQPFDVLSSSKTGNWLWKIREPKALYKASLSPLGVTRLELPNTERLNETDYRLLSDGSQLFERIDDRLTRYKVESGRLEVAQSTRLERPLNQFLSLQDSSTDQLLLLLAHNMSLRNRDLTDRRSVVQAVHSQNFDIKYTVEINDIILATAVDKTHNQIILAGPETLWFWSPRTGEIRSQAMLKSARVINGISVHPKGHTLAILCGCLTKNPTLYWMEADSQK